MPRELCVSSIELLFLLESSHLLHFTTSPMEIVSDFTCHKSLTCFLLGGGNSNIFYVQPEPWGNDPSWRLMFLYIFSDGVVQPPTSLVSPWGSTPPRHQFSVGKKSLPLQRRFCGSRVPWTKKFRCSAPVWDGISPEGDVGLVKNWVTTVWLLLNVCVDTLYLMLSDDFGICLLCQMSVTV